MAFPKFNLKQSASDIQATTLKLIEILKKSGDEIAAIPSHERTLQNTLLKWQNANSKVASLQSKITIQTMVIIFYFQSKYL